MRYLNLSIPLIAAFLFASHVANSQGYKIVGEESHMKIEGTSTLHDWHSEFLQLDGNAHIEVDDNKITDISELVLKISVESIESGKNGMDKNAREALKESEFPVIQFTLTRIENLDNHEILGFGLLTIAGVTREVSMDV